MTGKDRLTIIGNVHRMWEIFMSVAVKSNLRIDNQVQEFLDEKESVHKILFKIAGKDPSAT